ncbi:MAG: hypothetical protein IJK07_02250 [Bacteroidales bacterium]|nr:hypothetical protein [Bacteroidales bacterium]
MTLTIRHQRHLFEPRLPHFLFIDDHYAATMQGDETTMQIPSGNYELRIQCGGRLPLRLLTRITRSQRSVDLSVSSTTQLHIERTSHQATVTFRDRERLWNILFDLDLVAWLVSLFVTFPPIYRIISDAFFAIWLVRLIAIRKRYYTIEQSV